MTTNKKILILTPFFYPHTGGSQQYMEELYAQLLQDTESLSADVLTYNTDNAPKVSHVRGLDIYRISCWNILPGQFSLPNPFELISFLQKNSSKYDLIHCSTRFFDTSWWGPIYAKITGKKILLTDHCAFHPIHQNNLIQLVSTSLDLLTSSLFIHMFDKVYTTNNAAKVFLYKTFHQKSEVMYGGIDQKTFYPPTQKKSDKRTKVLFVGRMIDSKGARFLFEIAQTLPGVDFIFVGPGPLEAEFRAKIQAKGLSHINIIGQKTKSEVAELMREADILVHPSYHHEGFPNVLTEAGASKLAVIATNVGGSNEIIIDKKTGILIEPKNQELLTQKLTELIKDKKLQEQLAENLYHHVTKNFSWKKSAKTLNEEIQRLTK